MPTKTNDSPVKFDLSKIGTMMSRPAQQIVTSGTAKPIAQLATQVAPNIAKKGLGGLLGTALKANTVGAALTGAKAVFGGFKEMLGDRKAALDAGEKYKFGEGLKDFAAGALRGATGIDLTDQDVYEQPEYTTNIDPMTGQEIPLTMTGKQKPLKALTQMQGTTAHNMSAKQYNKALQMKEISGANTLPSSLTMIENPSPKQEAAFDHNNDGKVSTKELKTTFNS